MSDLYLQLADMKYFWTSLVTSMNFLLQLLQQQQADNFWIQREKTILTQGPITEYKGFRSQS